MWVWEVWGPHGEEGAATGEQVTVSGGDGTAWFLPSPAQELGILSKPPIKPPVKRGVLSARDVPDGQRAAEVSVAEPRAQGPAVCPAPPGQPGQTDSADSKGVR